MLDKLHLRDYIGGHEAYAKQHNQENSADSNHPGAHAASWWQGIDGLLHGSPYCPDTTPRPRTGVISSISTRNLCNDIDCADINRFISEHGREPNLSRETLVNLHAQLLERTATNNPYLALTESQLLHDRLTQQPYLDLQNREYLEGHIKEIVARTHTLLSDLNVRHEYIHRAAAAYLCNIDLGPLADLRNIAALAGSSLDVGQHHQRALAQHLTECDGTENWAAQATHLVETLATEQQWFNTEHVLATNSTLGIRHHQAAQEAVLAIPQWWQKNYSALTENTGTLIAYLPAERIRSDHDYCWETHRTHPDNKLLALPYAAGRLAQIRYDAPVAHATDTPNDHVLETMNVLVNDESIPINTQLLEEHLRTSYLLAPQY